MASRCSQVGVTRAQIELDRNSRRPVRRKRTKKSPVAVLHLCPNLGTGGAVRRAALRASSALPTQITFSSTTLRTHSYLWRVDWLPIEPKGSPGKLLAIAIEIFSTSTECNRGLGLIGFANCKTDPAYHVTLESRGDSHRDSDNFRLEILASDAILSSRTFTARKHPSHSINPEHDWSLVLYELARGKDAAKLTRKLTPRHADRPNSMYYVQRTVDILSTRLRLIERVPIADVVTLFEVRRRLEIPSVLCCARVREFPASAQWHCPEFNLVPEQERCFAPEEGWTRHPQVGNCGAPDGAAMFTHVNFRCVNRLGESLDERGIER
jgi:hypothetical protein